MKVNSAFGITLLMIASTLWGCETNKPIRQVFLNKFLKQYTDSLEMNKDSYKVNLDLTEAVGGRWDSVLVLGPYVIQKNVRSLNIANYPAIRSAVEKQSLDESISTLVFVGQREFMSYAVISPNLVDFSHISTNKKGNLIWLTQNECKNLHLRKLTTKTGTYFKLEL